VTGFLLVMFAGVTLMALQTTSSGIFFPLESKPELILTISVWAALRMDFSVALLAAFLLGILEDAISGFRTGFFALDYCLTVIAFSYLNTTFHVDGFLGRTLGVTFAVLFSGFLVLFERWLSLPIDSMTGALAWIGAKSLLTGFCSIFVFAGMDRLWTAYHRVAGLR
jgi:hypothetical protein